jgi:NitT/TauT family transport system substrate-binding protein
MQRVYGILLAIGLIAAGTLAAAAADKLTLVVVSATAWDSAVTSYGKRLGYFAEQGIDVDVAATDNMSQTLQVLISGSADIGYVSTSVFLPAALQGAPVRMIASGFKGAPDFLWYVRSDSSIQSFKDVTADTVIGVAALGTTGDILSREFLRQYGTDAKIVPVGGSSATSMAQVMAGQIDVAINGNGLLGIPQYDRGEVRPIAYGSEITAMKDVTVRGFVVSADTLANRRDVLVKFLQAFQKTVDWMYSHPQAIEWFAEATQSSVAEATRVEEHSYPQGSLSVEDITGLDVQVRQGLEYKRIERAPTADELGRFFQTIWHRPTS